MKTKTIVSLLLALAASLVSAQQPVQPIMTSYADVFPAIESRLGSLSSVRKVEDTAVASVASGSGSFASKITFLDGTTSAVFLTATYVRTSRINGVTTVAAPGVIDLSRSKYNPEGEASTPSLFYVNSDGLLVVPVNANFVGTTLVNPKTVFITEQRATLPKLVIVDDYWQVSWDVSGTYTKNGVVTPFSFSGQSAKVLVVNETDAPIFEVSSDYPIDPVTSYEIVGGLNTIRASGVTVSSYNKTWWMETSINLVNWSVDNTVTVAPNVTITTPFIPSDPRRFWRVKSLQP